MRHHYTLPFILLAVLVFGACTQRTPYQKAAKYWESDIRALEARDLVEIDPFNAILFVGSSSIRLWDDIAKDMAPYPVIQRAYGGAKYSDLSYYINRLVDPHQFRALVVFAGNDITGDPRDHSPEETLKLVTELEKKVHQRFPTRPIFFIGITPTPKRWNAWPQQQRFNQLLAEFCDKTRLVYYIDPSSVYLNDDCEPRADLFADDQLHQNKKGYAVWSKMIREELDEVLLTMP